MRPSLLTLMAIVALVAVLLGRIAADRRARVAALSVERKRQEDRVGWAERMQSLGYVSGAALAADREKLAEVESELERLGAIPREP